MKKPLSLNILMITVFLMSPPQMHSASVYNKSPENKKLEEEIRKKFSEHKAYVNPVMRNSELLCKCNHHGCSEEIVSIAGKNYNGVCRAHWNGQCQRVVRLGPDKKIQEVVLSCVHREQLVPPERPFVCQSVNTTHLTQIVLCCKTGSFCNDEKLPIERDDFVVAAAENETSDGSFFSHWYLLLLFGVAVLFSGFGLCCGIHCGARRRFDTLKAHFDVCIGRVSRALSLRKRFSFCDTKSRSEVDDDAYAGEEEDDEFDEEAIDSGGGGKQRKLRKLLCDLERDQNPISTGSGAGMPMLMRRTIAFQITLKQCIGRGRFGEVYEGVWRAERVAVKIFLSRDEPSWQRETDIYRHNMVRHSNLLRWIGSDTKDAGTSTQLWLVTEYLPNGSLYDFLEQNKMSVEMNIQFIRSIAHGLAYLHTEVPGINNQCHKPGIAHRDIKSKNILIKNDWTCCIADLGMAIRYTNGEIDVPLQDRGGTVRYLAPEFLSNTYKRDFFTGYLQMDIYAFALVIWEVCRRTEAPEAGIEALSYEIPYQEFVPREPQPEHLVECVHVQGRRPSVNPCWLNDNALAELVRIMTECWSTQPNSRRTALNIRCSLDKLCESENLKIIT